MIGDGSVVGGIVEPGQTRRGVSGGINRLGRHRFAGYRCPSRAVEYRDEASAAMVLIPDGEIVWVLENLLPQAATRGKPEINPLLRAKEVVPDLTERVVVAWAAREEFAHQSCPSLLLLLLPLGLKSSYFAAFIGNANN